MTKSILISTAVHTALILAVLKFFSVTYHKEKKPAIKKISLKHIVLKKETPKKVIKKELPKPKPILPKKEEIKPIKKKKIVKKKKKRTIKKRKKIVKKSLPKTTKKITNIKPKPIPTTNKLPKKVEKTPVVTQPIQKTVSKISPKEEYIKLNISKIYQAIERAKKYPRMAKKLKIQGTVDVYFTLLPNGDVINIKTKNAHKILQKAAYKTIKEASVEFPKPKEKVNIHLKINYVLK